jgi:LCP family protein required for cell wall assembly
MFGRRSFVAWVVCGVLALPACSPQGADESTTTTTSPASSTTSEATTTTSVPVATTTLPVATVTVTGEMPPGAALAVSQLLSAIHDPRHDLGDLPQGIVEHHEAVAGDLAENYRGTATIQELSTGGSVGIVMLDNDDMVLIADEGDGWEAVGAYLASVGATPWFGQSPRRVLVLGSDARPGGDASVHRMDSIHIVTAVPEEHAGAILGYPRDSYVDTDYGTMRINALTSSSRGPDALFSFFTDDWDVPLDVYILTGFAGFEDLVAAAVGRLNITLPTSIPTQEWFAGFSSGEQTLTPLRVLDFARTRKLIPGGDFTRSWHQGLVMKAMLAMLLERPITEVPMLLGALVEYAETNLTPTDLIQLGTAGFLLHLEDISNEVLPGKLGRGAGGASVVLLDPGFEDIVADVVDDGLRNESFTASDS